MGEVVLWTLQSWCLAACFRPRQYVKGVKIACLDMNLQKARMHMGVQVRHLSANNLSSPLQRALLTIPGSVCVHGFPHFLLSPTDSCRLSLPCFCPACVKVAAPPHSIHLLPPILLSLRCW